ncbi:MAG: hypothetical protein DMF78_11100 [Acidobacteria bacterium]|nr:MAG: hypothetical protein DMF78_11100 [Acidobacteriota bacterium]
MKAKAGLCAAAAALAWVAAGAHRARPAARTASPGPPFRVRGAPHVHTAFSADATGSVDDVARAARASGLQFVVITDHNSQAALPAAGYREGVLVVCGLEKSTDAGHALVLGTGALPFGLDGDPVEVARDAVRFGGFVVAAHPASPDRELRWSAGWDGIDAIEVLNFGQPGSWPHGAAAVPLIGRYALDPGAALLHGFAFSREALERWDRVLGDRPVAGLLGSDAHGGLRAGPVMVPAPDHRRIFALASQYLLLAEPLTGDAARDTRRLLDALREGRGYLGVDALGDASAFSFEATSPGSRAGPGEELPLTGPARLVAESGGVSGARLVLLRDGHAVAEGARIEYVANQPGVYRVEGFLDDAPMGPGPDLLPWIVSNPVYLFPADELAARRRRRAPPATPARPAGRLEVVDDFTRPTGAEWQVDRDDGAAGARHDDGGALRFDFRLGPHAPTHADLVRWSPLDLSRAAALALRVRGDRPLRFDLQVRTAWPGHTPPLRTWRRSVRAEPEWTDVALALDTLKTYDHEPGAPDLAHVVGLYVHVDESNLAPGSSGTLWIDDLALVRAVETPAPVLR